MSGQVILAMIIVPAVCAFLAWCAYTLDPKHPERLAKIQQIFKLEDQYDELER